MKEGVAGKIPNRVGDVVYALYTNYMKDRNSGSRLRRLECASALLVPFRQEWC